MKKIKRVILNVLLITLLASSFLPLLFNQAPVSAAPSTSMWVIGFQGHWGIANRDSINNVDFTEMTHVIYTYVGVTSAADPTLTCVDWDDITDLVAHAKADNPSIKVLVSLYGTTNLAAIIANAGLRATLVDNLVTMATTYSLDGVNVDWEGTTVQADYDSLVSELRTDIGASKLITATVGYTGFDTEHISVAGQASVDMLAIMCYDMGSYVYPGKRSSYDLTTKYVQEYIAAGYTASKLSVGIPNYAWDNNGNVTWWAEVYDTLMPADNANSAVVANIDGFAGANVTVDGGTLYWSGIDEVEAKVDFAKASGLGGVMLYALDYEKYSGGTSVLTTVYNRVNYTGSATIELNTQVAASADDGGSTSATVLSGLKTFDTTYRWAGNSAGSHYAFVTRFDVVIPDDAVITEAYMSYEAYATLSGTTTNLRIAGVDNADPAAWAGDLGTLTQTTSYADWNNVTAETIDTWYDSPSILTIIDELTNSYSYESGKAIGILTYDNASSANAIRRWHTYSDGVYDAPVLHLSYTITFEGAPSVSTLPATNLVTNDDGSTSGKFNGNVLSWGGATGSVYFEYGTTASYGSTTTSTAMSVTGAFSEDIPSTLIQGTTYHYRAVATNSYGTDSGEDKTFYIQFSSTGVIGNSLYRGDLRIVNNSASEIENVFVPFTLNTTALVNSGLMDSTAIDTALKHNDTNTAYMPGTGNTTWMAYVDSIGGRGTLDYSLYLGGKEDLAGDLAYFPASSGMTCSNSTSLHLGENWTVTQVGFFDTSVGTDKYIISKPGALAVNVTAAGNITVTMGNKTATATSVDSSWCKLQVAANTTAIGIYVDDVLKASTALLTTKWTDNANSWAFATNGSAPFIKSQVIAVAGVEKQNIVWENSATFSDSSGLGNNVTPTFASTTSNANVTATLYSLVPLEEAIADNYTSSIESYGNSTGAVPDQPAQLYNEMNGTGVVMNLTNSVSDAAGMPRTLFWFILSFLGICGSGVVSYNFTHSLFLQWIVMLLLLFLASLMLGVLPLWLAIVFLVDGLALCLASRQFGY